MAPNPAAGEDLFKRKSFTWSKVEAPVIPQGPKQPVLPDVCSCGSAFPLYSTFCSRCGALRVQPEPEAPARAPQARAPAAAPEAAAGEEPGSLWRYSPPQLRPMAVRREPGASGLKTSELLQPGEVFRVLEEQRSGDGVLYLRLADGRGWVMESTPSAGTLCVRHEGQAQRQAPADPQAAAAGGATGGSLRKGMWVRTTGLLSRPDLNGKSGILRGFDSAKGRWKVSFEDGSGTKLLRDENLEPLDAGTTEEGTAGDKAAAIEGQEAKTAADSQAEAAPKTDPFTITVCTCGSHLIPQATFCPRCGTMRDALPGLFQAENGAAPQAEGPPRKLETKEEFNRRIEEMLASGEIEWEDW